MQFAWNKKTGAVLNQFGIVGYIYPARSAGIGWDVEVGHRARWIADLGEAFGVVYEHYADTLTSYDRREFRGHLIRVGDGIPVVGSSGEYWNVVAIHDETIDLARVDWEGKPTGETVTVDTLNYFNFQEES